MGSDHKGWHAAEVMSGWQAWGKLALEGWLPTGTESGWCCLVFLPLPIKAVHRVYGFRGLRQGVLHTS